MPYIKIDGGEKGGNKGSSSQLVNYLEKENSKVMASEKEFFFSHDQDYVSAKDVVQHLDNNKAQLGKEDAKFFMITINPSEKELDHIGNDKDKLKEYTRGVMDEYAKNFNKGIDGKNLVYYAKIENNRYHKGDDPEVKQGIAKSGQVKEGNNTHIHVIVSRKDRENKLKLSPLTNHKGTNKGAVKGGFNRVDFKQRCEEKFDSSFNYKRDLQEKFQHLNTLKNSSSVEERISIKELNYKDELSKARENRQEHKHDKENDNQPSKESQHRYVLKHPSREIKGGRGM